MILPWLFSTVTTPNQMIDRIVVIPISTCHNSVLCRCGLSVARGRPLFLQKLGLTRDGLVVIAPPIELRFPSCEPSFCSGGTTMAAPSYCHPGGAPRLGRQA